MVVLASSVSGSTAAIIFPSGDHRGEEICAVCFASIFSSAAIHVGNHQIAFAFTALVADESEASAIRREAYVAVYIVNHPLGSSAENGQAIKAVDVNFVALAAQEVDAVSVGRKGDRVVAIVGGRDDLRVALGGDVA